VLSRDKCYHVTVFSLWNWTTVDSALDSPYLDEYLCSAPTYGKQICVYGGGWKPFVVTVHGWSWWCISMDMSVW
jgi:hypothetical protein